MKQVFKVNESLRRLLCGLLVAIMVFGMIPMAAPKAAAAMDGKTLYIKPNGGSGDTAWYFAHFYNDGGSSEDVIMTENSDGNHYCTVPSGYSKVVFGRMNPAHSNISWNIQGQEMWNQTDDLSLPTDGKNCFQATDWNGIYMTGSWTTISDSSNPTQPTTPPASNVTAYLAGSWTEWESGKITMTGTDGKNASVTIQLNAGKYEFKIIYDNVWYTNIGEISDSTGSGGWDMYQNKKNCVLNATGGSYTFTYNKDTKKLVVTHSSSGSGGGGGTTDDTKLYVGTTFYDYRTNHELGGGALSSRTWNDMEKNGGWHNWYVFGDFNNALSSYYSRNNVKVPIYMGHFQPDWDGYGYQYNDSGVISNGKSTIYGLQNWPAAGNSDHDQKWFMSVNNSLMSTGDPLFGNSNIPKASWGIVAPTLVGENKQLMAATTSGTVAHPLFNETFLNQKVNNRTLANIYHDVQFPFTLSAPDTNGLKYWVYDSEKTTLKMNSNFTELVNVSNPKNGYYNRDSGNNLKSVPGFFPFNTGDESHAGQYNYGFGMRLDLEFNMTDDGMLPGAYGQRYPMIFSFSGDDDVWVFIDGQLVLDIGGSHGEVTGSINFADKVATVSSVKTSLGNTNPKDQDNRLEGYQTSFTMADSADGHHTLTMFYMERGMWESNMSISFNLVPKAALEAETTTLKVTKKWDANNIPDSIDVQLQRRLEGQAWESVGDKVALQKTAGWVHTFTEVKKFADPEHNQKYEFRVVELDGNNVLEAGDSNSLGQIVTYSEIFGDEAMGLEQYITNIKPDSSVVVIDFGLPVDVTIDDKIDSYTGTLYGIGDASKLPIGQSTTFAQTDLILKQNIPFYTDHGYATLNGTKIRYTPTDMKMDKAELIGYALKYSSNGTDHYYYSTLTVIPAANIYYEDSFLEFANADETVLSNENNYGKWQSAGTTISNAFQQEDRPGTATTDALKAIDKDNVYGYDPIYGECREYSLGSAYKVTVNAATGNKNVAPKATFTFTGTGFDVVSLTDSDCGAIMVEAINVDTGKKVSYIVNNYYGMIYNPTTGKWDVLDETDDRKDDYHLYQVPVMKVTNLEYGTYNVTIRAAYLSFMDMDHVGEYTIWLDAIRIYNPAQNDQTSKNAYADDKENNAVLTTVKKLLLSPDGFTAGSSANGIMYVEGKSDVNGKTDVSIQHYANQGPNNETYLKNNNAIAFKLRYVGTSAPSINVHIGAKLATGSTATMNYNGKSKTLTTATNMFYDLGTLTWTNKNGTWESNAIVISCTTSDENAILSLTDLKITGANAENVGNMISGATLSLVAGEDLMDEVKNHMGVQADESVTLTGAGFSLSFQDEILVNYYYSVSDLTNVTEHGMLVFNTDPGAADIAKADQKYDAPVYAKSGNLYACTTSGIAAKEMGDSRYYCAYAKLSDGTIVYSDLSQYSPKEYAMSRLEKSDNEAMKALCVAMLNYGAAAQQYFGYKTDDLMNAELTDAQKALVGEYNADLFNGTVAADPEKIDSFFTATETGFERIGATVSFEGAFALNFYFQPDCEVNDLTFYFWTNDVYNTAETLDASNASGMQDLASNANGIYHGAITGIAAKELDDTVYVAATYTVDGQTFCSGVIAYSLSGYCMKQANGNMGELAQATAMYGYYAESYFSNIA